MSHREADPVVRALSPGLLGTAGPWEIIAGSAEQTRRIRVQTTAEVELRIMNAEAECASIMIPSGANPDPITLPPLCRLQARRPGAFATAVTLIAMVE